MPRHKRVATGGLVFHVLNCAVAREKIFWKPADYEAFAVLQEAGARVPMRLLCYCIMPNHWHLVLWPRGDDDLSEYMRWLTVTHAKRWHGHYHSTGSGALYQGRFKSFPIQQDEHFVTVCHYLERNALRANLVDRAEQWRWSSLWHRVQGSSAVSLAAWPIPVGTAWIRHVNCVETEAELKALRRSVVRGAPFWRSRMGAAYGSEAVPGFGASFRGTPEEGDAENRLNKQRHPTPFLFFAVASYYQVDVLLTWNCRHLANPNKMQHIRLVNYELGLPMSVLTTPLNYVGGGEFDD